MTDFRDPNSNNYVPPAQFMPLTRNEDGSQGVVPNGAVLKTHSQAFKTLFIAHASGTIQRDEAGGSQATLVVQAKGGEHPYVYLVVWDDGYTSRSSFVRNFRLGQTAPKGVTVVVRSADKQIAKTRIDLESTSHLGGLSQ